MRKLEATQSIMEASANMASRNRRLLDGHRVFAVNIMSTPGTGETSLVHRPRPS